MRMSAAEDRSKGAPQEEPLSPELAAGPEPEMLQPEKSVTFEYLKTIVGEAVARAEDGRKKIEEVNAYIKSRVDAYRGELNGEEQSKLGAILAEASSRLRALQEKAAVATGEAKPVERAAAQPDTEEVAALKRRIEMLKHAQGEPAGGEHYRKPAADILQGLEAQLAALQSADTELAVTDDQIIGAVEPPPPPVDDDLAMVHVPREPLARSVSGRAEPALRVLEPDEILPPEVPAATRADAPKLDGQIIDAEFTVDGDRALGTGGTREREPQVGEPEVTFENPTVEGTPTAPEARAETAAWRPQNVRELLNSTKLRQQIENPAELATAMAQAKYAERRGITENAELRGNIEAVIRAMSGKEGTADGLAKLDAIAAETGIPLERLQDIVVRQRAQIEDRARREVAAESQVGVKKVLAKGVAYAGLGALLQRIGGVGWLTAPIRMVEAFRQGKVQEGKVQARIAELEQQLAEGDATNGEASLGREVLSNIAAEISVIKQQQIDGQRDLSDSEGQAFVVRVEVSQFLKETRPELSPEQRLQMAHAAGALFTVDQKNAALELQVSSQQPNAFRKLMTTMDKVLGSKLLRGGESGKERSLTVGVFAAAGVLAREIPIVRNILFGYTGMKAGEFAANMITKRAGRYEVLQPVTSEQLAAEGATKGMIDRARVQLLDGKLRAENPAEYQKIREALDRHEERLFAEASAATDYIDERNAALEQGLADKTKLENEKKVVVNGARVAGALLGAALGPMVVGWIAEKFQPEAVAAPAPVAAAEAGVSLAPEVAPTAPETDPRILELAMIRKGDGFTQVISRQLEAQPDKFGYSGDLTDTAAIHDWAVQESKVIAQGYGFLDTQTGRITEFGLQPTATGDALILHEDGSIEPVGHIETPYVHKPLGFETPDASVADALQQEALKARLVGMEESARQIAVATERDIESLRRLASGVATSKQEVSDQLWQAEMRLAEERRLLTESAGLPGADAQLREGVADQERVVAELRKNFTERKLVDMEESFQLNPGERVTSNFTEYAAQQRVIGRFHFAERQQLERLLQRAREEYGSRPGFAALEEKVRGNMESDQFSERATSQRIGAGAGTQDVWVVEKSLRNYNAAAVQRHAAEIFNIHAREAGIPTVERPSPSV
ncbi:MAG: hypothetical protein Q7S02_01590 [bacterium]|nr:hypothetical protein [bacterium]